MKAYIIFSVLSIFLSLSIEKEETKQSHQQATLYIFEGSDWCVKCKQLDEEILQNALFISKMEELNIIIEKIDFPQKNRLSKTQRKYNENISEKYNFQGVFPSLILTKEQTSSYRKISYKKQRIEDFVGTIKEELDQLNNGMSGQ